MSNWEKVKGGGSMPLGAWKRITPLLAVQGVHYRRESALSFARTVLRNHPLGRAFGLIIEPEPHNPIDPNALKVIGWGANTRNHIGYVEAIEAADANQRFPGVQLAAEFYSVYIGTDGFIDIRYFLSAPATASPVLGGRVRSLLDHTRDELLVLSYAARADNKLGRLETDILNRYAYERARDFGIQLVDEDVPDIKRWCRDQTPSSEEVQAAIHRMADDPSFSAAELWELIEVVLGIDGKISKKEKAVATELAFYIRQVTSEANPH